MSTVLGVKQSETVLVMKTVSLDMEAYGEFIWPKSGEASCREWDPSPICGKGLHGFLWGEGNLNLLTYPEDGKWLVLEVELDKIVDLGGKVKFPWCKVIYCGDMIGAAAVILGRKQDSCCPGSGREYIYKDDAETIYFNKGLKHREGGPAVERIGGDRFWYKEGILHREDGPAIQRANGNLEWYIDGLLHREDGPALDEKNKQEWYYRGVKHRLEGPAELWADGNTSYWIDGFYLTESEFFKFREFRHDK